MKMREPWSQKGSRTQGPPWQKSKLRPRRGTGLQTRSRQGPDSPMLPQHPHPPPGKYLEQQHRLLPPSHLPHSANSSPAEGDGLRGPPLTVPPAGLCSPHFWVPRSLTPSDLSDLTAAKIVLPLCRKVKPRPEQQGHSPESSNDKFQTAARGLCACLQVPITRAAGRAGVRQTRGRAIQSRPSTGPSPEEPGLSCSSPESEVGTQQGPRQP